MNFELPNTGNFQESYFNEMKDLINKIKTNKYINTLDENQEDELKENLHRLGSMFYLYDSCMKKYKKNHPEFEYKKIELFSYYSLPCSHNYNVYISKNIFSPLLFQKYYMLMVNVIESFVDNRGDTPKYLYNLIKLKNGNLFIEKKEYFTVDDVPNSEKMALPYYYTINGEYYPKEKHREMYEKYLDNKRLEEYWEKFLVRKWPIIEWISKNRKDCHFDEEIISYNECMASKKRKE